MKNSIRMAGLALAAVIFLSQARIADAAEIKLLYAIAMQQLMEDLGPKFERTTGYKLAVTIAALGPALKRIDDGETYDVVLLPRRGIESLVKDGKAVASSVSVIAITRIGVAVRKGAAKPDISSPEALKSALLAARSITYSNPAYGGLSGVHVTKVLDRLGISEEMKPKTVLLDKAGLAASFCSKRRGRDRRSATSETRGGPRHRHSRPAPG